MVGPNVPPLKKARSGGHRQDIVDFGEFILKIENQIVFPFKSLLNDFVFSSSVGTFSFALSTKRCR
jgi:hypothetical protein